MIAGTTLVVCVCVCVCVQVNLLPFWNNAATIMGTIFQVGADKICSGMEDSFGRGGDTIQPSPCFVAMFVSCSSPPLPKQ
mmetsp:Transcript_26693/g.44286  ORF Transcript_26693/g.44286 Transcript_26693/m.44286 type:complete len:80 (-) Transcript_26693:630-869(-)